MNINNNLDFDLNHDIGYMLNRIYNRYVSFNTFGIILLVFGVMTLLLWFLLFYCIFINLNNFRNEVLYILEHYEFKNSQLNELKNKYFELKCNFLNLSKWRYNQRVGKIVWQTLKLSHKLYKNHIEF